MKLELAVDFDEMIYEEDQIKTKADAESEVEFYSENIENKSEEQEDQLEANTSVTSK